MDLITKFKSAWQLTYQQSTTKKSAEREICEIPLHTIRSNPYQPRRYFDSDTIEELSQSIKKYGVIQPITVRRISQDSYELIAGERRLRACSMCGMLKVPAIVIDLNDNDSAVVALTENIQRENLSFMEEAEAYRNLLYHHGLTQEELAKKLGKTQSAVANKVRLLKLASVVREIITDNSLSERHARALLRLSTQEEQLKALEQITTLGLNVQQTEALVDSMLEKSEKNESTIKIEPPVREERLKIRLINKKALKDVRVFLNTIRHAISLMQENGVNAESDESESDTYYEYTIRIPKNSNK